MFDLISKEKIRKIVIGLIGDLTVKYSYYEMSIILDVNEKNNLQMAFTIYNQKLIISLIYKFYIIL